MQQELCSVSAFYQAICVSCELCDVVRQAAPARLPFLDGLTHIVKRLPVREAAAAATHLQVSGHSVPVCYCPSVWLMGSCPECIDIVLRHLFFAAV